jgi:beta-galactosidase
LDVVALDCYPTSEMPASMAAMRYDLMRGLKNGDPFMLMEQSPSQLNWKPYNALKRPGVMRLWSYQAVARGADTVMFFQLRRSLGAFEKFHGAMIDHAGHEHTRVFRECAELGRELGLLGDAFLGARVEARVAILFDWDNWWAVEHSSGPSVDLKYVQEVQKYYDAFYSNNIQVDFVSVDDDFGKYDVLVAPVLYMVKPGCAEKLKHYVRSGGVAVSTFFSGIVGESDLVVAGGYPGELRELLGIWVEEIDALPPQQRNRIVMKQAVGALAGEYDCGLLCDLLHTEGAEVVAEYGADFYRGMPALTRNRFGQGEAWYVASSPDEAFLSGFAAALCAAAGIAPAMEAPPGVEISRRVKDGRSYVFVLNHNDAEAVVVLGPEERYELLGGKTVSGETVVGPKGVLIVAERNRS